MKRSLPIPLRVALTAGTVIAIGFAFVTLAPTQKQGDSTPSLEVRESEADIFSMSLAERTSTQKFQAALERLGHEKPRVYDLNGNTVMFSTNIRQGSVERVVQDYLQTFADEDLNPHVFDPWVEEGSADHQAMLGAAINGGIIPWVVQNDYMSMGGGIVDVVQGDDADMAERLTDQNTQFAELLDRLEVGVRSCATNPDAIEAALENPREVEQMMPKMRAEKTMTALCEGGAAPGSCDTVIYQQRQNQKRYAALMQVVDDQELESCGPVRDGITGFAGLRFDDFTKRIKGFRSIEAWHDADENATRITATWSDESFDMTKTQPSRYGGVIQNEASETVPTCPGCRRTWAFGGTGSERKYASNMLISPMDIQRTAQFYIDKFGAEGWEIPESDVVADEMARIHGAQKGDVAWVRFRKGNEHLAMQFERDPQGRTIVRTGTAP